MKLTLLTTGAIAAVPTLKVYADSENKEIEWDAEFDVIVVGSGLSGHIAAIVTAEAGLQTMMIEKMPQLGGNSVISQQDFAVMGSDIQAKNGIKDSVELYVSDLSAVGRGFNDVEHTRRIAVNSNRAYEFARDRGVEYGDKPKHLGGHSVARSLKTIGGGRKAVKALHKHYLEQNGGFQKKVKSDGIIKNDSGKVIGLVVREGYKFDMKSSSDDRENTSGITRYYRAKKAVVFATGGYSRDAEFRTIQNPRLELVKTPSNLGATAGALKTMIKAGATPIQLSLTRFSFGIATEDLKFSMMVDSNTAQRITNEDSNRQDLSNIILSHMTQTETKRYPVLIFDSAGFANSHDPGRMAKFLKRGKIKKFDTIKELADAFEIPADKLQTEVEQYNKAIAANKDEMFGKDISELKGSAASKAPYYAISAIPNLSYTQGGVQVTTKLQVIDIDTNKPIPGLYAVGESTGGVHGFTRLTSCSIPDCMTSGIIAGETIIES